MGVLIYIRQFSCTFSTLEYFSAACAAQRSRSVQPLHIHSGSCAPFSQGFRALVTDCAQALRPVSGISGFLKNALADFVHYGEERHGFLPFKEIAPQYLPEHSGARDSQIAETLREGRELIVQVEK